ncbi:uncharacterized protein LOC143183398 [Calliopsis andreniformis]|uniref:uncharacterized protein LOC143183398 n=1 Tax=Calliopsis andreniformis TaxID=337506 RepID=UPI003FCC9DAC
MRGGPEEEAAERRRWIQAEQKKINDSVQALINKRKLCKPVGTSEKEAEDKKKTKEDEEVAELVCTSNELLHLEEKKKSGVSSSSSSSVSSSSDEEVENDQEDGTGQKGAEKSDGRRPMAEEEGKACGENADELLLPWRTQVRLPLMTPHLIEEITEGKEYIAGDAEKKRLGKKILDGQRSINDVPGGCVLGRELAHYEKLVLNTTNETEITPGSCASEQNKEDTIELQSITDIMFSLLDRQSKLFESASVSCALSNSNDNPRKESEASNSASNERLYTDILDDYRGKDDRCVLSSQLNSIREDMKEFCADMDKFVEDNKIVFKNDKQEEKESSVKKEDTFKWWSTKERKSKIKEIMREKEEETKKKQERAEGVQKDEKIETVYFSRETSEEKVTQEELDKKKEGVYDLLNLKTCPKILLQDVKTYSEDEGSSKFSESTKKEKREDLSGGVFNSLFNELNYKNRRNRKLETSKSLSSHKLLAIEEIEETVEEPSENSSNLENCISVNKVTSHTDILKSENIQEKVKTEVHRIEIVEVHSSDFGTTNSTDDDESDNESVKTVIDMYEESTKIETESGHADQRIDTNKSIAESKDRSYTLSSTPENTEAQRDHKSEENSDVQSLNTLTTSSGTEKTNQTLKSYKRTHDCDHLDIASKKSHLIEEVDSEKNSRQKTGSEVFEWCRRHLMKEAKQFMKNGSPLIDRCIESLITHKGAEGNWRSSTCDPDQFLTCASSSLDMFRPSSSGTLENSKLTSSREGSRGDECTRNVEVTNIKIMKKIDNVKFDSISDIRSLDHLLKQSQLAEKAIPSTSGRCMDLYEEFCQHLDRMNAQRKLLIEPDFMKANRIDQVEKKRDALSPRETKQSKKKQQTKLIEVVSKNPTDADDTGEPDEAQVDPEDSAMDPALKDRILKSINAPKSEEQMERARKSADKLKKISREAMAKGKSLNEQSPTCSNQQRVSNLNRHLRLLSNYYPFSLIFILQFSESRRFFMDLMKEDPPEGVEDINIVKKNDEVELDAKTDKVINEVSEDVNEKTEETVKVSSVNDDQRENECLSAMKENKSGSKGYASQWEEKFELSILHIRRENDFNTDKYGRLSSMLRIIELTQLRLSGFSYEYFNIKARSFCDPFPRSLQTLLKFSNIERGAALDSIESSAETEKARERMNQNDEWQDGKRIFYYVHFILFIFLFVHTHINYIIIITMMAVIR